MKTNLRLRNLAERRRRDTVTNRQTEKSNLTIAFCTVHSEEKVRLYCIACKALACQLCQVECHNSKRHNIVGVTDRFKEQKSEIQVVLEDQRTKVDQSKKKAANKLKEQVKLVNESLKCEEESIAEFTKQRIDEIEEEEDRILRAKLQQAYSPKMEQLQRQLAETEESFDCRKCS